MKKEQCQYPVILVKQARPINGLLCGYIDDFFLWDQCRKSRTDKIWPYLACIGSQSEY